MRGTWELELPLGDGPASAMAQRRIDHLAAVAGVPPAAMVQLARAYRSLAGIYSASEADLAKHVGRVAAARIRWFLDAPLDTRVVAERDRQAARLVHAA
jgi:ERCC4-type nuclease